MANETPKIVDEYSIAVGPNPEFPTVWLTVKLDDGSIYGPFEFVPAFAHKLSDELCIASARTAKKTTGGEGDDSKVAANAPQG